MHPAARSRPTSSTFGSSLILILWIWQMGVPSPVSGAEVLRRSQTMGTVLQIEVQAPTRAAALAAAEAAMRAVEAVERRLSTWDDRSELSRFNHAPVGAVVAISPALAADLAEMEGWWRVTAGAYHPALASLVAAWDLRGAGRLPTKEHIARAVEASSMSNLDVAGVRARRLHPEFGIEEGGFGKGAALRQASSSALAAGGRCVWLDLGGQVAMAGRCDPRRVDVADPDDRHRSVATLWLAAGSIATSGNSERGLRVGETEIGHLVDPATGWPAADFGSVTVAASDPVAADCLATALFVMGPRRGLAWVEERDGVEALFVVRDSSRGCVVQPSSGMVSRLIAPDAPVTRLVATDAGTAGIQVGEGPTDRQWRNR